MSKLSLSRTQTVIGAATLAVDLAAWFNISPESVGQALYDALFVLLPFLAGFGGFLIGYGVRGLMEYSRVRVGGESVALTKPQAEIVRRMRNGERFEVPTNAEHDVLLQLADLGVVESRSAFNNSKPGWRLLGKR